MRSTGYVCKVCGIPVEVSPGGVIKRSCDHHTATVLMQLDVVCTGKGSVSNTGLLAFLRRLGAALTGGPRGRV
jgi:hypothetical protein